MKKKYVKPILVNETFTPNEYVAACWKINCNVEKGIGFIDTNGNKQYDWSDQKICFSNPRVGCGEWHTGVQGVPDDGPVANAMWQPTNDWGVPNGEAYDVYWWSTGNRDHDQHFSKVEKAEWATNPNAS